MKKTLLALCLISLLAVTAQAADTNAPAASSVDQPKKHKMTPEQESVKKELTDKYDTNKDGKLDKDEMAKMSADDKTKWKAAFPVKHKKKSEGASSAAAPTDSTDTTK